MIQQLYSVYDEKALAFLPPFFVPTHGIALRAFKDCVNSKDHQFGKHPADYTLFYLGDWDDTNCEFDLIARKSLGNGVEFKSLNLPENIEEPLNGKAKIDGDESL